MATNSSGGNATGTAHPAETSDAKGHTSTTTIAVAGPKETAAPAQPLAGKEKWFHWHEPGTSKEEKRLIFKLDWFLLSYACLMFFIKQVGGFINERCREDADEMQLDQNNISNAYVSGMSDELGFGPGNELSWMNTYFSIGTRPRPACPRPR